MRALVFTNILFGLWHAKNILVRPVPEVLEQIAYAGLVIGPVMTYVAYRARSIYPSVMIHAANNILAVACFAIMAPK